MQPFGEIAGKLGDGTNQSSTVPVTTPGLTGVTAVGTGFRHVCAMRTADVLSCWGDNTYGAVGDGTTTQRSSPVSVIGF